MDHITQTAPSILAAFLASLVEFVEALTVVLAVGIVRGWKPALIGTGIGLAVLVALVVALGPALTQIPLRVIQLLVGTLLLLFGLRWLRKAILRAAGVIPLHDEEAAFAKETASLQGAGARGAGWDAVGVGTAFKIVILEGIEVVFIVIAIGAGGRMLIPASIGAALALVFVAALGLAVHRPLSRIPENTLKFTVGVLLAAFGTFWAGEGIGIEWPGADFAILGLAAGYFIVALVSIKSAKALVSVVAPNGARAQAQVRS